MQIQWYGQSCFRLQTKFNGHDVVIVTDPYLNEYVGLKKPKLAADIVTLSHEHKDHADLKSIKGTTETPEPFIIKGPGEYEFKNIFTYGVPSFHDNNSGQDRGPNTIYVFYIEGIKIAHLGDLGQTELTTAQLELVEGVDILLIPVGGKYTINAAEAIKLIGQIDPRIIIPMHYKIPGLKIDLESADKFIKEMGNNAETMDKLKITKKDLPQEETRLIVLNN